MKKLLLYTILIIPAIYLVVSTQAVSLSVSPKEINASVLVGQTTSYRMQVKNPSGEVSVFEVYPDDLQAIIKIYPSSFILESEETKDVIVQVTVREEGVLKTNISVVATPVASSSFNAVSGVKIPIEITSRSNGTSFMAKIGLPLSSRMMGIIILALILVTGFFVIRYGIKQIKI